MKKLDFLKKFGGNHLQEINQTNVEIFSEELEDGNEDDEIENEKYYV